MDSSRRREESFGRFSLMDMPVATSFFARIDRTAQARKERAKIGNDGGYAFRLRLHAQQCLFEIKIQGQRPGKLE